MCYVIILTENKTHAQYKHFPNLCINILQNKLKISHNTTQIYIKQVTEYGFFICF